MPVAMTRRMTVLASLFMCADVSVAQAPAAARAASPLLFVSNEASRDVTVVRLPDLVVVGTVPVGERPRGIQTSRSRWPAPSSSSSKASPRSAPHRRWCLDSRPAASTRWRRTS